MARRIGIFGGTFDPPHIGHLVTAIEVRERLDLDVVFLVVAHDPWQKTSARPVSPAEDRLGLVRAAVADLDGVEASDLEIRRGGPSYTVDTLEELHRDDPTAELFLVVGSDAASGIGTWERSASIPAMCRLVVVERPGHTGAAHEVPAGFDVVGVDAPRLEVSSTDLRDRVAAGRSLRFLLSEHVISEITRRGLYRGGR
jgi:nicotinate-nucleotide adenylyltransferase